MIKKITIFLFASIIINIAYAATPAGAQVTYRNIGSYKFEITYKMYRDCRGIPLNVNTYQMRCSSSGSTKSLKATLVSITDITNPCRTGTYCNPPNQTVSTSAPLLEELTYMDTLDFNGAESAFKSCCMIQIGAGTCCRNNGLTNGGAGNDFLVYSTLDLCNAPTNSSPIFRFNPDFVATTNEVLNNSYFATDTIDGDSLSYAFAEPLTSFTSKVTLNTGFDYKNTFSAYYPTNYNKANGPNPDLNPPIGIYLDSKTGNFKAMAASSSEYSMIAVAVKEWRKDSKGKYIQIGEITIEHPILLLTMSNHTPSLNIKSQYNVCEGKPFTLDIISDDQQYNLPAPASPIPNDTVKLAWNSGIKGAKFSIKNANAKKQEAIFEWTPATGDYKKMPFNFTVLATDNNCSPKSRLTKTIQLKVYPKINVTSGIKKLNNSTYSVSITIDNKNYTYLSGKYITSENNVEDKRNYIFKSSNGLFSDFEKDTIIFKKNGTYIINQSFLSQTECNSTILKDTIIVTNVLEVNLGIAALGHYTDTSVCKNQLTRIVANVKNASNPVSYTWKLGKNTTTNTLGYFDNAYSKSDTLFLSIKDNNNQVNSTYKVISVLEIPEISAGKDEKICPSNTIQLKAKSLKTDNLTWAWLKDGKVISNGDSLNANFSGNYVISATNVRGCTFFDTLLLSHFNPIKIDLISGKYCQDKNSISQSQIMNGNANLNFDVISWKLIKSLPKLTGGNNVLSDVLIDKNANAGFDFLISFDDSRITFANKKDSLIFIGSAIDTNGCYTTDTMTITLLKKPTLSVTKKPIDKCINLSFSLDTFGNSGYSFKWVPYNANGFGTWPSLSPLTNGFLAPNFFKTAAKYKAKIEATNEFCASVDSLVFTILPLPRPVIGVLKYASAIRFRDESINKRSSKWYINNTFYSSADTILLSKSFVHLQPIKLEVLDNSGCINDTTLVINTQVAVNGIHKSLMALYPNPSGNYIILRQIENWIPTHYEIYDAVGKLVISGITQSKEEQIDLKGIEAGLYFVKYYASSGSISSHFIKSE